MTTEALKPVAWIWTFYDIANDRYVRRIIDCEERPHLPGVDLIPLYTAPPHCKPLSDEEILKVYDDMFNQIVGQNYRQRRTVLFARAIEQAHGIGGEE